MGNRNSNFNKAKKEKNDEFYTMIEDVENELKHYDLKGKIIYCNCDTGQSAFVKYLKSRKDIGELIYTSTDFRSKENIEHMKRADIVITNPPFSLFREYITQLMEHDKKFLVIGNFGSFIYKEIFKLVKSEKIWMGVSPRSMKFLRPDGTYKAVNASWFTNLNHNKRNKDIECSKEYNEKDYTKYDNYNAINIDKVKDIPKDYKGEMGVPVTFLSKYNPEQFEIVGFRKGDDGKDLRMNGKRKYTRLVIRRRAI